MTDPKKEGREPASIFWEERACQFDDLSPAIAAICRDKANSAWLAAECDRLTAALRQSSVDKTDAERYRWLRDAEYDPSLLEMLIAPGVHRNFVDAAIDAALEANK